jgi:hypothetical protein
VRRTALHQKRIAGGNLAFLLTDAKPEPAVEDDPGLVV